MKTFDKTTSSVIIDRRTSLCDVVQWNRGSRLKGSMVTIYLSPPRDLGVSDGGWVGCEVLQRTYVEVGCVG